MTRRMKFGGVLLPLVVIALSLVSSATGLAIMSIDLGSEFMKIAIVKPGVPMEIALNRESRRKTPVVVAMRDGERTFSDPAMSTAVKYPQMAYGYLQDLLGKTSENPVVKAYQKRFPYYQMETDPDTSTIQFKHDDTTYTPEELLAMILEHAKEVAGEFAEQPISDAVITVPPFFNQAERRALLRAAEMSGIKVLQLMNANTAVALNYGVFRRKVFNATAVHYMFYDMGATSTTATVVAYQLVKTKSPVTGVSDTNPQLTVKGVGFNRNLGGLELQMRLRDHLAKLFTKQKKTSESVYDSPRSMAKLFKEAGRLKNVLSANQDHYAQIESLLDDEDFKAKVTRADFEDMCKDFFDRVSQPVKDALKMSEVTLDEITEVILMGGGTRVPMVQEKLREAVGRSELGKSINTDEAAALGAVYQAAHLSKGFKVKKFGIKEANIYPIQVEFERVRSGEESPDASKVVKRMLFGSMNPYPQKKVMTFNKHIKDFTFDVGYGDLGQLTEEQAQVFGSTRLQKVTVSGVEPAFTEHGKDAEAKGIKAHFRMDESGILHMDKVESVFEKPPEAEEASEGEESTLQKLGNFFFGGEKKEDAEGGVEEQKDDIPTQDVDDNKEDSSSDEEEGSKSSDTEENNVESESQNGEKAQEDKKDEKEGKTSDKKKSDKKAAKKQEKNDDKKEETEAEPNKESGKESDKEPEKKANKETKKDKKDKAKKEEKKKEGGDEDKKEGGDEDKKEGGDGDKEGKKGEEKEEDEKKEEKPKEEEKKKEMKPRVVKVTLQSEVSTVDLPDPSKDKMKESEKKLSALRELDATKKALESIKNELETFIFDGQDKIEQDNYKKCSTEEERENILGLMASSSDWLYEQDEFTELKAYQDKLKELKSAMKGVSERVYELQERPRAQEALTSILNYSETFLVGMANYTGEDMPFTEVEATTLGKLINSTKEWNATMMTEQAETPLTEKPKVTVEDIARKLAELDREVKYLINKAKTYRPKVKDTDKDKDSDKKGKKSKAKKGNETEAETEKAKEETEEVKVDDEATTEKSVPDGTPVDAPTSEDRGAGKEEEQLELGGPDVKESLDDAEADKKKGSSKKKNNKHDPDDEL